MTIVFGEQPDVNIGVNISGEDGNFILTSGTLENKITFTDSNTSSIQCKLVSSNDSDGTKIEFVNLNSSAIEQKNLTIRESGNIGIGTTNPSQKLEVNGNLYVGGTITGTGIDTTPNSSNTTQLITSAGVADYVTTQINNLIGGAPSTLDTLNEIAAAINDDANIASTLTASIASKEPLLSADQKIAWNFDQSEINREIHYNNLPLALFGNKGATENNFSTALQTKLNGIETGAQVNVGEEFTSAEKTKLNGIETGAQVNVGEEFTSAEKTKLAGVATSANNYTLPTASASTLGGIKIGTGLSIDASGVVTAASSGGGGASVYAYVKLDAGYNLLSSGQITSGYYIVDYGNMYNAHTNHGANNQYQAPYESHTGIISSLSSGTDVSLTVPTGESGGYFVHASIMIQSNSWGSTDIKNSHFEIFNVTKSAVVQQSLVRRYTSSATTIPFTQYVHDVNHYVYLSAGNKIVVRIWQESVGDRFYAFSLGFHKIH